MGLVKKYDGLLVIDMQFSFAFLSYPQLVGARICLGIAEAGLFPGAVYWLVSVSYAALYPTKIEFLLASPFGIRGICCNFVSV